MKRVIQLSLLIIILGMIGTPPVMSQEEHEHNSDKLVVLWTSGDIEVAEKLVFMYVYNAKKAEWFDDVTFIIWGPSAKLLSENEKLQAEVKKMKDVGIKLEACIACARMYEVVDDLKDLGVDVKGMGRPLSDYLKKGYKVLTF